jgi:CRISPR-associated endoribonuclease Cas6
MRFLLKLSLVGAKQTPAISLNYHYLISAAIYKIIGCADSSYATFLHDEGHTFLQRRNTGISDNVAVLSPKGHRNKRFKFFTFSDIRTPFQIVGDQMILLSRTIEITVCFHINKTAENFVKGLFMEQRIYIGTALFKIDSVESIHYSFNVEKIILQPISPLVVGRKNDRGHYDYRSPQDSDFSERLIYSWIEKYCAIYNIDPGNQEFIPDISITPIFFPNPPQRRLVTIKKDANGDRKVRGYTKFRLEVNTSPEMLEIALNTGLGLHNSQGMGCVSLVNNYGK